MHAETARSVDLAVRAAQHIWNTGRVDELDVLLTHDYVRHGRIGDTSAEALKKSILLARTAFPDLRTTIEHIVADGDLVATHWRSTGTHSGPFYDLPVTGRPVVVTGMTFSRVADGRIAEEWENWDHTDLFASLGVVNLWEA
ncbi:ester cyclase [Mycobacterium sp. SMC-4]|uniref:ester cyclase n=1 Tax=Mycobacterium sp. SMC-4 TaxID=2857059 RepID=UPI003D01095E